MQKLKEKKIILLIDDNEFYHAATKAILKDKYEIITAKSGQEAVEYLFQGTVPDLILLDIVMPDMDGWVTYHRIKEMNPAIPIAFATSLAGTSEMDHARDVGVADFIVKPFKTDDLLDRIERIIRGNEEKVNGDQG